ncbi:spondin domain-containing protein [Shewanella maritima]|uniref:spondin domain-containing protein n=1 Tax=Shewanella maritima TaxID=2520507 RepID=UPI00373582FA
MKANLLSLKPSLLAVTLTGLLVAGCSDSDDDPVAASVPPTPEPVMQTYEVTVTNLTANQPLSPVFVATHSADLSLWQAGMSASVALEKLAEGGDSADLAELDGLTSSANGTGVIMPGMSETISVTLDEEDVASLSLATMLVNTNDAFAGVNAYNLTMLDVDETSMMSMMVYDAGTEQNSEAKGSLPGPADGGEGYNSMRDDVDFIHVHPGVISMYDGLMDSVLDASHRFDNPGVKVTITRTE